MHLHFRWIIFVVVDIKAVKNEVRLDDTFLRYMKMHL